jgi:putative peptidoglycan lipid II flippase
MNAIFVPLFGHAGLALSVSLGATINAVWLFVGLKRGGWYRPAPGWGRFALKVVFATLAMSGLLAVAAVNIDWLGLVGREGVRIAWLSACLGGAAAVYFGVLLAAGMRPRDFSRRV